MNSETFGEFKTETSDGLASEITRFCQRVLIRGTHAFCHIPPRCDEHMLIGFSNLKADTMSRTIPELRTRMHEIANERDIPELHGIAEETRRNFHGRRAPIRARHVTEEIAAQVRTYAAANPTMCHRDIGRRFDIDGGRVSEILHGKRGEE